MTTTRKPKMRPFAAIVLAMAAALVLSTMLLSAGCSKKDEEAARLEKEREWAIYNLTEGETPPPKPAPLPSDLVVEVPKSVKDKYKGVELAIGNRKTRKVEKFKVMLGDTAKVPGTDYTVKVGQYLPTWIVRGKVVTVKKDEPIDPAVRATIYKGKEKVFDGFLFQKHMTPSFMTDEYVIALVGAIKR